MQCFAANRAASFSEDFESQILGKFITKNTTFLPCSEADFNSEQKKTGGSVKKSRHTCSVETAE